MKKIVLLLLINISLWGQLRHDCTTHCTDETFFSHVHLQSYVTKDSEDIYSGTLHGHLDAGWNITDKLTLSGRFKIEQPHHDHHGHEDDHDDDHHDEHGDEDHSQWFEDHLGYLEELKLSWQFAEKWQVYAGKFNPKVGLDYHSIPGWYGYEALEHYGIKEQIGIGMQYQVASGDWGNHYINVSTFFQDTTFLSHSILADRKDYPNNEQDGGVGNTEELQSWAIQLAGDNIYFTHGDMFHEFGYAIGGAHQAANKYDDTVDENRFSFALDYTAHFYDEINVRLVSELCLIIDEHGEDGVNAVHTTFGAEFNYYSWQFAGSYTDIERDLEANGHMSQLSVSYFISENLSIGTGWLQEREEGETTDYYGFTLTYSNW